MLRRLMGSLAGVAIAFVAATGIALAAVEVNTADQAKLESIKGIGPAISAKIIAERRKGPFKDWSDLETRVPGIGAKNATKLSEGGLTVGGHAKANAPAASGSTTAAVKSTAPSETKTTATKPKKSDSATAPTK